MDKPMQAEGADILTGVGSAASMLSGGVAHIQQIGGYTVDEWTVFVGLGGFVVAVLGLLMSGVFKYLDYRSKVKHRRYLLAVQVAAMKNSKGGV